MLSEKQLVLLRRWLAVSRSRFFTAVLTPAFIGIAAAAADGSFSLLRFWLLIIGLVLAESMNLLLSDWAEFQKINLSRGRIPPPPHLEGNPMLPTHLLPLKYTHIAAFICAIPALGILIYFAIQLGWPIWVFLVVSILVGMLYIAPAFPFAFFSTALLPPIIAAGSYFVMTESNGWQAGLSGIPVLFISAGVIYNYRVLYERRIPGRYDSKRILMMVLYASGYVILIGLAASGMAPRWTLLGLITLPVLLFLFNVTAVEKQDHVPATSLGVLMHFATGILIAIGYVVR